ncbi:MerR family transcriptional regulator [Humibacter albus]|uniref:MerR family transcriptional regulator n=1 Tax=Humibacter albus TaxID=427754 RepID=UPI0003B52896|nr:MerR family transcriptional regulator [Humibacter albus]
MLSIGEFASIGRVSVRMLRHYDEIGLLRPARVDPATGYRSYEASQLTGLSRIVELKGLGLTLEQIARVQREDAVPHDLETLLVTVRADLRRALAEGEARLRRIEAQLRTLKGDTVMPTSSTVTVEIRSVEPQRVATLTRKAPGFGPANISPVIGPMYPDAAALLAQAGVTEFGPGIALYEADESGDGSGALVTAGFVVPESTGALPGLDVHDIPAIPQAAITVHRGEVSGIGESWMALTEWLHENDYELIDVCREVYWTPGDSPQSEWITDLVQPVAAVGAVRR